MDPAKSHYTGDPMPQSSTLITTKDATSYHLHFDIVTADGKPMPADVTFPVNGGPVDQNGFPPDPAMDHASMKVSGSTWTMTYFDKNNKPTAKRIITYTETETVAKLYVGGKVVVTDVMEKQ